MTVKRLSSVDDCPRRSELHTPAPRGYLQWHQWADHKSKTHKQERCPECGLWAIWVPLNPECPTCDHARTLVFDHATSRVTGHCPHCNPDEMTSHLTPDVKALAGEVERLRAELDCARQTAIAQVVAWIRHEYAEGRADGTFSYYGLALADDIERRVHRRGEMA